MALPGVKTILKDRFHSLSRTNIPEGTRVAAVARRGNVELDSGARPDYDPYSPNSELDVINAFGEDSELHRAYVELVAGGAARVDLVPVPADVDDSGLSAELDTIFGSVEAAQSDIVVLWGRGGHPDDLTTDDWDEDATPATPEPATPASSLDYFGFHADNSSTPSTSFVKKVADHCDEISGRSNPLFAVLGVKPYTGTAASNGSISPANLTTHLGLSNLVDREEDQLGNVGHFVSVIAAELRPVGYPAHWGYANGAATYAGFLASLEPELAPTGRKLFNISGLRYAPTRPQHQSLIDKGVVSVGLDFRRQAKIIDGLTFAKATSDYTRLSTLRIVYETIALVRSACSNYIGMPSTMEHRNAMDTAIRSALRAMTVNGVLLDSDFDVTYSPAENKALVDLVVRPAFEIRNIEISVAVDL